MTRLLLAASNCPPLTQTVPVDCAAVPTLRPALTLRVPPPTVNIPPGPSLLPTTIVEACSVPPKRLHWPTPELPMMIGREVAVNCPPVIHTEPVEPVAKPMSSNE